VTIISALEPGLSRVSPEVRPSREWAWLGPPVKPSRRFHRAVSLAASVAVGMPVDVRHPRSVHPAELVEYLSFDDRVWELLRGLLERSEEVSRDAGRAVRRVLREGVRGLLRADVDAVARIFLPVIALGNRSAWDDRFVAERLSRGFSRVLGERVCLPPVLVGDFLRCVYELAERVYVSVLLARAVCYRADSLGVGVEELMGELSRPRVERPPGELEEVVGGLVELARDFDGYLTEVLEGDRAVVVHAGRRLVIRPSDYDPLWSGYTSRVGL